MIELFSKLQNVYKAGIVIASVLIFSTILISILKVTKPQGKWDEISARITSWWIMASFFFGAIIFNQKISLIFFAFLSFWSLKEYFTILDTRREDHMAIFWAFIAIPIQYYWVLTSWYGMFIIFIPVYMFLFFPLRLVLAKEPKGFLLSTSRIHWGIMAFVFCISHMGYLLVLPEIPGKGLGGQSLLLFLVILTEMNDVFQFIWGKSFGKSKITPKISPNKTWAGFLGGVITTSIVSVLLMFLTPFTVMQTMSIALVIGIAGFFGDVVMSALKRDVGIKDFGNIIPGHGGIIDRVDSLCYTAPLFFHIVYYLYY
ncbi:MAG: hypothetical protein ACD_79C00174G0003 [uncultured bacterium]|nr:MAG: hypothetical protein ACD_79C00174G0003 [uncultured bacterium]